MQNDENTGCPRSAPIEPNVKPSSGIDQAIAFVQKRRDEYVSEKGMYDPSTGMTEFPGNGEEYVVEWEEIIEGLEGLRDKALATPQAPAPQVPEIDLDEVQRVLDDNELCKLAESVGAQISWANDPDEFHHLIEFTPPTLRALLERIGGQQ